MPHKSFKYYPSGHGHEIRKREQNRTVSSRGAPRGSGVERENDKGMGKLAGRRGWLSSSLFSLNDTSCHGLNTRIVWPTEKCSKFEFEGLGTSQESTIRYKWSGLYAGCAAPPDARRRQSAIPGRYVSAFDVVHEGRGLCAILNADTHISGWRPLERCPPPFAIESGRLLNGWRGKRHASPNHLCMEREWIMRLREWFPDDLTEEI